MGYIYISNLFYNCSYVKTSRLDIVKTMYDIGAINYVINAFCDATFR
jgi:hypothetical protein